MESLTSFLASFITADRWEKMRAVAAKRTDYLVAVVEDLYQEHNASAVLRSADGYGLREVHIIERRNTFKDNRNVSMGTGHWLDLKRHKGGPGTTRRALEGLKQRGYRIVATSPHHDQVTPGTIDLEAGPMAIVFGNELKGISDEVREAADEYLVVPMAGFAESFNISVCAAVVFSELRRRLEDSSIEWLLSDEDREALLLYWLRRRVKRSAVLEKEFLARRKV